MDCAKKSKILYSCSGCSSSAQMANWIAIQIDRKGLAEMSCIAGIGGGVRPLVRKAKSADLLIGIDGCSLGCVKLCLSREGLKADFYYNLQDHGIKKKYRTDFDCKNAEIVLTRVTADLQNWSEQ